MLDRRKHKDDVTPQYEDSGLFKTPVLWIEVHLTPKMGRNARGDYLITGYVERNTEIEVVFAGRRRACAEPAISKLKRLWTQANRASEGGAAPKPEQVRMPVRVNGAWRPRFQSDQQGWVTRSYQLTVAEWSMIDPGGAMVTFGEPPLVSDTAKKVTVKDRKQA